MPSVNATWEGRCPDPKVRADLIRHLRELAALAHRCFEEYTPYRYWKKVFAGKILIDAKLVGDPRAADFGPPFEIGWGGPVAPPPPKPPKFLLEATYIHLHGVEFRLPCNFYSRDDRISFMFAFQDSEIQLPWVLVQAEDQRQCSLYQDAAIGSAGMLLRPPAIHMRYAGEEWISELLGWIKHYYLPDLDYWRRTDLPAYAQFARLDPKNAREREISWRLILDDLVRIAGPLRQPAAGRGAESDIE